MAEARPLATRAGKRTSRAWWRPGWLRAGRIGLVGLMFAAALQSARAADRGQPKITVAPTILAEPASQAALSIQIGPPEALPNNSFIRLRGLPFSISLTEGHAIGPGSWAIP